jgi:hypothetical protein
MYPKIFTHRHDSRQQVVIANAEQEAQLPAEFLPPSGAAGTADNSTDALLSSEYASLKAEREQLDADKAALEADRATLTAGYKQAMADLEADREQLAKERAAFEAEKAAPAPEAKKGK